MTTCSLETLGGSVELEGVRTYDLARLSTKADLTGRSASTAVRKKSFSKYDSLGSQFEGSLSLNLLPLHSGSFPASAILDIKKELGFGPSSSPLSIVKAIPSSVLGLDQSLLDRVRPVHDNPHNSHVAMKEQKLCQDVGTICTGANSYLFKISTITGELRRRVPVLKGTEAEIEDEVEDIHNPFEDSKDEFEDAIVNLKEEEGEGIVSLSLWKTRFSL
ncbi:hypothetical protein Cgig2_012822 [Carnegiea gigantea]|uniref:Uncharacterized protein n=1 Tax=Carnegiea gigantea TaxID=171969 RepID=A0A9Q1GIQ2_9CARY|nr:hypothetical protein Cgig2_012822 [Carnegiea gigantea]